MSKENDNILNIEFSSLDKKITNSNNEIIGVIENVKCDSTGRVIITANINDNNTIHEIMDGDILKKSIGYKVIEGSYHGE